MMSLHSSDGGSHFSSLQIKKHEKFENMHIKFKQWAVICQKLHYVMHKFMKPGAINAVQWFSHTVKPDIQK